MKKLYFTLSAVLLAAGSFAQNGQLNNGGFEDWSDINLYEYPTQWKNANQENDGYGMPTVFKSTDAQAGLYSCEITVQSNATDTTFGYVFHGNTGNNGPDGGIPYSDSFDEVRFQYKSDIVSGDTLMVIAIRYTAGVMTSMDVVEAAQGTAGAWTAGSAIVPAGTQDSLFIGFIMGNPFGNTMPDPASWARIDAVEMYNAGAAVTNVPDPGFEDWSVETVEEPNYWYTLNALLAPQGLENAIKTIDANTGTYAIEMTTIEDPNSGDTINAFISKSAIDIFSWGNPFTNGPYSATPTTFSGAYKYTPANGDNAAIQITWYAGGVVVGMHQEPFSNSPAWQTFSSALTITSQPDSMLFIAYSGDNPGSVLKLDDLSFSGGDVSLDEFSSMNISMYPNPASSSVMIKAEGTYNYAIVDLAGNVIMTDNDVNGAIQLDINNLSNGAYFVTINNAAKAETHKLIVE